MNRSEETRALNRLPPSELDRKLAELTRWYSHFHGGASRTFTMGDESADASSVTLATKLAQRGVLVSNYRIGSYISQANAGDITFGEAATIERVAPFATGTWWPGHKDQNTGGNGDEAARLALAIDSDQTNVHVSGPARYRPSGAPETWPYVPSRGSGAEYGVVLSANSHDFVSWGTSG